MSNSGGNGSNSEYQLELSPNMPNNERPYNAFVHYVMHGYWPKYFQPVVERFGKATNLPETHRMLIGLCVKHEVQAMVFRLRLLRNHLSTLQLSMRMEANRMDDMINDIGRWLDEDSGKVDISNLETPKNPEKQGVFEDIVEDDA